MNPCILLVCVLQGAPVASTSTPAGAAEWRVVNSIRLIVNEEAITARAFLRETLRRDQPTTTQAEADQHRSEVAKDMVDQLLMIQAGRDFGFDETMIEHFVREDMQSKVDRAGSVVELGAQLEAIDTDPQTVREGARANTYGALWQRAVYGYGNGPAGRAYVDRYVRPGRLLCEYRRSDPLKLVPATVTLQRLWLVVRKVGGVEKSLELARALRQRLIAGESIEKLGEELAAAEQGGINTLDPLELAHLQADTKLGEFASEPKVGAVSEPLPTRPRGEIEAYVLLQIQELHVPDPPTFESGAVQQLLRNKVELRQRSYRSFIELNKLLDAAYVWPPADFGRKQAAPDG